MSEQRRPMHDGGGIQIIGPSETTAGTMYVPVTPGELLVKLCQILDDVRGPGDAVRAVLEVKREVDRWEAKGADTLPPYKGQTVWGPQGVRWTYDGARWVEERG